MIYLFQGDCENGHEYDRNKKWCIPICETDCGENGRCISPNTCICSYAYGTNHLANKYVIRPQCTDGRCAYPYGEQCREKFVFDQATRTCIPVCTFGFHCSDGNCTRIKQCQCPQGFILNEAERNCIRNTNNKFTLS